MKILQMNKFFIDGDKNQRIKILGILMILAKLERIEGHNTNTCDHQKHTPLLVLAWFFLDVLGCAWLCLVVLGCAWLCLVVLGCAWLCLVVLGCVWLCLVVLGYAWLCLLLVVIAWLFLLLAVLVVGCSCCWLCLLSLCLLSVVPVVLVVGCSCLVVLVVSWGSFNGFGIRQHQHSKRTPRGRDDITNSSNPKTLLIAWDLTTDRCVFAIRRAMDLWQ
ncbi:unnamed protein product [Absidia cylindrospora]